VPFWETFRETKKLSWEHHGNAVSPPPISLAGWSGQRPKGSDGEKKVLLLLGEKKGTLYNLQPEGHGGKKGKEALEQRTRSQHGILTADGGEEGKERRKEETRKKAIITFDP